MQPSLLLCKQYNLVIDFIFQIIDFDHNNDGKFDDMTFSFSFDSPATQTLTSVSMILFFETTIENQCTFLLPTALIYEKTFHKSMEIHGLQLKSSGSMSLFQQRALQCPYFMRNIKSHFNYRLLNHNSTEIIDYKADKIQENLKQNPAFLKYDEDSIKMTAGRDTSTTIELAVSIRDTMVRYNYTLWQKLNQVWIQYLAIFVIFFLIGEKIKYYIFKNQYICTWEVVPWKKLH